MSNNEKSGSPGGNQPRWITVKFKMLGIFSIMLALLVLCQAANYFLTLRSVRGLKEFYGNALERNETLDFKHLLYNKLQAIDNYILFPDESHMGQLLYADKAFVQKLGELGNRRRAPADPVQNPLQANIVMQNAALDREVERIVKLRAQGVTGRPVAADLNQAESIEKVILFDMDRMYAEHNGDEPIEEKTTWWSRLADIAISYFNPVVKAGLDIHVESDELSDYIKIRNLVLQRVIASRHFLITGQNIYVEEFNTLGAELEQSFDHAASMTTKTHDNKKVTLDEEKRLNGLITTAFDRAVQAYRSGSTEKAKALILSAFLDKEMLESSLDDLIDEERGHITSAFAALTPIMNYALSLSEIMFIYIILAAGLMSVIIYAAVSRMVRPIVNLDDAARKIAQGDWTQRVEVRSRDEIGRMSRSFNKMTENLEKAETEVLKNQSELSALYDVSRAIGRTIDLEQLLTEILETIIKIEVFNLEHKGAIFIVDGDRMNIASYIGESPAFAQCCDIKVSECLCGLAAKTGEIVVSINSMEDENHTTKLPHAYPHGHIIVPLKAKSKVVGVLCLYLPAGVVLDEDKKTLLYILGAQIGIAIDNAKLYEETKSLSLRDSLTGLANRRLMDIMLEKSFARAQRVGSPFSCIMLDIDFFKKYNDTYGHPAGDSLLKKIAEILLNEVRAIDLVVRYGGEEFFVLLPDAKLFEAQQAAERIRMAVEAGTGVTISLGVASYHQEVQTKEYLIKKADEALYQAKKYGRNRVETSGIISRRTCG